MKVLVGNINHVSPEAFEAYKKKEAHKIERRAEFYIYAAAVELDIERH